MPNVNPGDLNELVRVRTPQGESSADDRDSRGFVDQHGAAPTDTLPEVWARVEEASTQEFRRAGGEAGQRLYAVTLHEGDFSGDESSQILRVETSETLEVVAVRRPSLYADYRRLICKRAT